MFCLTRSRGIGPAELADEGFAGQRGTSALRRRPSKAGAVSGFARIRRAVVPFLPALIGSVTARLSGGPFLAGETLVLAQTLYGTMQLAWGARPPRAQWLAPSPTTFAPFGDSP